LIGAPVARRQCGGDEAAGGEGHPGAAPHARPPGARPARRTIVLFSVEADVPKESPICCWRRLAGPICDRSPVYPDPVGLGTSAPDRRTAFSRARSGQQSPSPRPLPPLSGPAGGGREKSRFLMVVLCLVAGILLLLFLIVARSAHAPGRWVVSDVLQIRRTGESGRGLFRNLLCRRFHLPNPVCAGRPRWWGFCVPS